MFLSSIYVKKSELNNVLQYKYHGVDKSILAKFLQPFWNRAVLFLPDTLAPNAVTLIGFFFIISSYLIHLYYCPGLQGQAPSWVYFFHAFSLFFYQTMDAIDGKQARRTGNATPLGELFDHGCDALTTSFLELTVISTLQIGAGWWAFATLLSALIGFNFAQVEEFHLGTLELGYVNVTEGQFVGMMIFITTGIMGAAFWVQEVVSINLFGNHVSVQLWMILTLIQIVAAVGTVLTNLVKLYVAIQEGKISTSTVVMSFLPMTITSVLFGIWAMRSSVDILHDRNANGANLFLLTMGFIFAFMIGRVVFARICKVNYPPFQLITLPALIPILNSYYPQSWYDEKTFLALYFIFAMGSYSHLAMSVITVLCDFLKIKCLTITKKVIKAQ